MPRDNGTAASWLVYIFLVICLCFYFRTGNMQRRGRVDNDDLNNRR